MKEFHSLITNTTSLVGYIAILMFVGAYLGGNQSFLIDPTLLKGSLMESRSIISSVSSVRSVIITIDGREYQATLGEEINRKQKFTY
ncbi:hypothetical protein AUK10_00135 [Candidatus Gracilibacteria bacterium CG2_30_37_12]|nr:MAG: hypothetical protein AUK10_00135 [Candidatus Gracilibacteria bacterium CG2_30_37_12]